jgi:hypothetical protein
MLCSGLPADTSLDPRILYGVSLDDLLRDDGSIRHSSGKALRAAFRLPPEGRICLVASVRDERLEGMWPRMDTDLIWKQIRRLGFEFVTGLTCSVFEHQSRNGQLFNQERNMLSVELLAREGVPVVPIFCEVIEEDLNFAVQWLRERPALRVIAGLAQGWRTDSQFARFLRRMQYLKNQVAHPLHFVVVGCSSADRIPEVFSKLEHVTVTNANFVLRGVNGESWDSRREEFVPVPREEVGRGQVVRGNIEGFMDLSERCARHPRRAA